MVGLVAAAAAFVAVLAVPASPVLAVNLHPFLSEVTLPTPPPGIGESPFSIAINQTTHHIYVSQGRSAVANLTPEGKLDPTHPRLTGVSSAEPYAVAIDNSGGATNGFAYTTELSGHVRQFDANGAATAVDITNASIPSNGTPQSGGLPPVVKDGGFRPKWVAVDGSGNVLVTDDEHLKVIDAFNSAGTFVAQYSFGDKINNIRTFAIGPGGQFYLLSGGNLYRLAQDGTCVDGSHVEEGKEKCNPFVSPEGPGEFKTVSVTGSGNVLLVQGTNQLPEVLLEYDSSGALSSTIGEGQVRRIEPGAVLDEGTDQVYSADMLAQTGGLDGPGRLLIFGATVILPDATTLAPTDVTDRSVVFNGEIGADGGLSATCVFQYVGDQDFNSSGFANAAEVPCEPTGPFTDEAPTPVEASVVGLSGGTAYHVRLLTSNENGSNPGKAVFFTTKGPTITGTIAAEIGETAATLRGFVNPNGSATTYRFQYLSLAEFEANPPADRFAGAKEVPLGGELIGSGEIAVAVSQRIEGLAFATAYRFRIVATGVGGASSGDSEGPVSGFSTFVIPPGFKPCPNDARRNGASGILPDCRAYEQASPIEKNGASVQGETNAVQASPEGGGITFFSGLGLPGGEGAQSFPSYLASRGPDSSGWSTRGLLPPASTGPYGAILGWSDDLQRVYTANKLIGFPEALYGRQAEGPLTMLAQGEGNARGQYSFAAESGSGGAVLFENHESALVPAAVPGETNAYVWDKGTGEVHLAGVLNSGLAPSEGSFAGSYDWFGKRDTEVGAAESSYYLQSANVISKDGSRAIFTTVGSGQLYMRENPVQPQSPLDGEGNCTNPALACTIRISESRRTVPDPAGEMPAAFLAATSGGSSVFFTSTEKLTEDATGGPEGTGGDLYRYDAGGSLVDLTPDTADAAGADVQGLLGMSQDGSYVYFAANGVLAPGAQPGNCTFGKRTGECSVYVAHGGAVEFVARLRAQATGPGGDVLNWAPTSISLEGNTSEQNSARVSPDGQTLLLRSKVKLTPYENAGRAEIYRYVVGSGLSCISCNPTGEAPLGDASLQGLPFRVLGPRLPYAVKTRNLSAGGKRIFFDTPDRLVAADTNGVSDVYEWEASGVGSCESASQNGGCLYLISTGSPTAEPSFFGDADETGDNAFFFTSAQLVPQDKDELVDVYDARVDGGIAAQETQKPEPCLAEGACLGSPGGAPPVTEPKSPATTGANVKPPKPCKKAQVRRHGKCVKKKKKHRHHKKRKQQQTKKGHGKGNQSRKGGAR